MQAWLDEKSQLSALRIPVREVPIWDETQPQPRILLTLRPHGKDRRLQELKEIRGGWWKLRGGLVPKGNRTKHRSAWVSRLGSWAELGPSTWTICS